MSHTYSEYYKSSLDCLKCMVNVVQIVHISFMEQWQTLNSVHIEFMNKVFPNGYCSWLIGPTDLEGFLYESDLNVQVRQTEGYHWRGKGWNDSQSRALVSETSSFYAAEEFTETGKK